MHGTTTITTLATFNYTNGDVPTGVILDSSGNLFGTTSSGGTNGLGTVFEIAHNSFAITVLASFNYINGANPDAASGFDSSGNLYGTTGNGGSNGVGTIFEIANGATAISALRASATPTAPYPQAALTLDSNGNVFGTTLEGGDSDLGTVFEFSPTPPTLSFTAPPASANAGSVLNSPGGVQVSVLYPWGNTDIAEFSTVTLTLTGGNFADGGNSAQLPPWTERRRITTS